MNNASGAPGYDGQLQPGYELQPVCSQPEPGFQWQCHPAVKSAAGCPPGLEYLTQIDQILIKQHLKIKPISCSWGLFEFSNIFMFMNNQGEPMSFAVEDADYWEVYGTGRSFVFHVFDANDQEVIRISRVNTCFRGMCWCACADACAYEATVEAPVGHVIGFVRQECSAWVPNFAVRDVSGNPILRIHGPYFVSRHPCFEMKFSVWTGDDKSVIGQICKIGGLQECCEKGSSYMATFPMDLDVKFKAILFGAVLLIDFMHCGRE